MTANRIVARTEARGLLEERLETILDPLFLFAFFAAPALAARSVSTLAPSGNVKTEVRSLTNGGMFGWGGESFR
jgi:hypothetical protein